VPEFARHDSDNRYAAFVCERAGLPLRELETGCGMPENGLRNGSTKPKKLRVSQPRESVVGFGSKAQESAASEVSR